MEVLFWFALLGTGYSYFVYPLILLLLPRRAEKPPSTHDPTPAVTLIITAYNEEGRIEEKLNNTASIDYPRDKLQVIVASDASTDGTDDIVRRYGGHGVRLVRAEVRKGKEYAQGLAINESTGEILVFSDTATQLPEDGIRRIAANFRDPSVGAVSSEDRFVGQGGNIVGEGLYVRYEMWLRKLESSVNSLTGLSGSFFAARREVCDEWDIDVPSDFNTALNCVRLGYVAVTDPESLGYYQDISDPKREYQRKLRTVIRGLAALAKRSDVLDPFRFKLFAFQVWSHKVMRWLVPWFMILLLGSSIVLRTENWLYTGALGAQVLFYVLALAGALSGHLRSRTLIRVPTYFVQVNAAIAHATVSFLLGKRIVMWEPSRRG